MKSFCNRCGALLAVEYDPADPIAKALAGLIVCAKCEHQRTFKPGPNRITFKPSPKRDLNPVHNDP